MRFTKKISQVFTGVAAALALSACASGPVGGGGDASDVVVREVQEYRLSSGDEIRITVFDEPDLSGEFQVDGLGVVSLPLVGEIEAQDLTVRELQRKLEAALEDGYLNEPRVAAEVLNYRPFYILGEVGRPGTYPFTSGLTVMNAVATAEGFTYRANRRIVYIKPSDQQAEQKVALDPTTLVQPGDTIRIVERLF